MHAGMRACMEAPLTQGVDGSVAHLEVGRERLEIHNVILQNARHEAGVGGCQESGRRGFQGNQCPGKGVVVGCKHSHLHGIEGSQTMVVCVGAQRGAPFSTGLAILATAATTSAANREQSNQAQGLHHVQ